MLSLSRQSRPHRCPPVSALLRGGFTLIELVISLAVLGTMAAGVYLGFNSINTYAVSSRLYSEAQTAAQNQIDLVLSKEPFDIQAAYISGLFNPALKKIPIEVMTVAEIDRLAFTGVTFQLRPLPRPLQRPTPTIRIIPISGRAQASLSQRKRSSIRTRFPDKSSSGAPWLPPPSIP